MPKKLIGEQKSRYKLYKTRRGWQLSSLLVLTSGLLLGLQTVKADDLSSSNQTVTTATTTIEVNNVQTQEQSSTNSTATTNQASSVAATASSEDQVATADVVASQPKLQSSHATDLTSQAVSPSTTSEVTSEVSTATPSATTNSESEVEGNFEDGVPYDPYIGTVFQEPSEEEKQGWNYYREDFSLPAGMRVVQQVGNDERPTIIRVGLDDRIDVISEDKSVVEPVIYIKDPDLEYGRVVQVRAPLYPGIVDVTSYSLSWGGTVYQGKTHRLRVNTIHPGIFKIGVKPKVGYDVTDYQTIYRANPNLEAGQIRIVQKGIDTIKQVSETLTGVKTDLGEHYGLDETVKNVLGLIEPGPASVSENVIEDSNFDLPTDFSSTNLFTSFFTTDGSVDLSPIFLDVNDIIGVGTEILGYLSTSTILQTINGGQDQIIEVGTKPTVIQNIIAYNTIYEATDILPAGEQAEKQAGVAGIKTETTTYQLNEATGELTASKEVNTKSAQNRIILVGTKAKVVQIKIPYQVIYEATDTLPAGEQVEKQAGVAGIRTETTTYQLNEATGELMTSKEVSTKPAQNRIVLVGTKAKVVQTKIPYQVKYEATNTLPAGQQSEKQVGVAGNKTETTTYRLNEVTGELTASKEVSAKPAQNRIVLVGTKAKVVQTKIPYQVKYEATDTLLAGQQSEKQVGVAGNKTETTTYQLNEATGELTASKEVNTKPAQNRIVLVGTKAKVVQTKIPYQVIYEATDTLPAGEQAEKQVGVAGIKTETTTYRLNEATGELTANTKVSTKASQTRIVRVGVKPKRQIQLVDYQTKYQDDDTLPYGYQQVVQNGYKGLVTTVTTYQVDKTGQVLPTVTVTKTNAQAQVIRVGTKSVQIVTEQPYLTLYLADDSLAAGLRQEKQAGKKQVTLTTITYSLTTDGQVISHRQIQTLPGQAQIIKVGVKTKVLVVPSAFKVSYQADNTLAHGQRVITQFGEDSLTKYITTYSLNTDGSLNASETSRIILGQAQVIRVGVKPTRQQTIIPYQVIYQNDGQLEAGKQVLLQAGKEGLLLRTIAYKLNENGTLTPYVTTITLPGLAQIIKVGTKVASPLQPATTKKELEVSQPVKTQAQPIPVPLVKTTAEDKLPATSPLPTKAVTLALARVDGEIAQNLSKAELGLGNSDRDYQITGLVFKEVDQKLDQSVHQLGTIKAHHPRMLVLDSAVFESKWNWLLIGVLTIIGIICFKEDKKPEQ